MSTTRRSPRRELAKAEPASAVEALPIHVRYRPTHLDDVLGQSAVVKSLRDTFKRGNPPHSYLFVGPSGTGKTTLSRILASNFQVDPSNIIELDAATHNGIDDMREITATLRYQGFGDTPNKLIIIDECHALTKQAWQSLLKAVEEPPAHVYLIFCTTEAGKVPATINTRCSCYTLNPVKFDDLMDLLERICDKEDFKTPTKVLEMVARAANGSPRQALTMLATVHDSEDLEEVAVLLSQPGENAEVIDLCRALVSGNLDWKKLTSTLKAMPEMPAESIRIVISCYLASCLMGATSDKQAGRLLDIAYAFSKPYNASDKMAPLFLSFGDVLLKG